MNKDFEQIREVLEWYADSANYQEGIAGDRTLFGWESDNGDRARKALRSLDRLSAIVQQPKPEKPAKNPSVQMLVNARMDLFARAFFITHYIPLFAQAWVGFCKQGKGCLVVAAYWENDLSYRSQSRYFSVNEFKEKSSYPNLIAEVNKCVSEYDPSKQIVVAYCANDFSEQGKRFAFKLEQNYYEVRILDGEYTPKECAEKMGIQQTLLNPINYD